MILLRRIKTIALITIGLLFLCTKADGQISLCDDPSIKLLKNLVEEPTIHRVFVSQVIHDSNLYYTFDDGVHGTELWTSDGTEQGTRLLADIYPGKISSGIDELVVMDDVLYFKADDGIHGGEVHSLDLMDMNATVVLVKDILPGPGCSCPEKLTVVGSTLYFTAYTPATGRELYSATSNSTAIIKEIIPGIESAYIAALNSALGKLFFQAQTPTEGLELWVSDGTATGTTILKDFAPGTSSGASRTNEPVEVDGFIYFLANDNTNGNGDLWKSDGTSLGTTKVKKGPSIVNGLNPQSITALGSSLLMSGSGDGTGAELFHCDGDSVYLLQEIRPGTLGSRPYGFEKLGNSLIFLANDGTHGAEPWISDGTSAGTAMLKDINSGTFSSSPLNFTNVDGNVYFITYDIGSGSGVWKTDGSEAGTTLMLSLGAERVNDVIGTEKEFYFTYGTPQNSLELYYTDGTAGGSGLFHNIQSGTSGSYPQNFITDKEVVFFHAHTTTTGMELYSFKENGPCNSMGDQSIIASHTKGMRLPYFSKWGKKALLSINYTNSLEEEIFELWETDGSTSGTNKLDINLEHKLYQRPVIAALSSNFIAFTETDSDNHKIQLSDGTPSGTSTIIEYTMDENVNYSGTVNNRALFELSDNTTSSLWAIDNMGTMTQLITSDININESQLRIINGKGYFINSTESDIHEFWATDGTPSGTMMIKSLPEGLGSHSFDYIDGKIILFVESNNSSGGNESSLLNKSNTNDEIQIWTSDGTSAGTVMVTSIVPDEAVNIRSIVHMPDRILFSLEESSGLINAKNESNQKSNTGTDAGVWATDGTIAGTIQLASISYPSLKGSVSDKAYFTAEDLKNEILYVTDGTITGTKMINLELSQGLREVIGLQWEEHSSAFSFGGQAIFGDAASCQGRQVFTLDLLNEIWLPILDGRPYIGNASLSSNQGIIALGDRMITLISNEVSGTEPYVIDCSCQDELEIDDQQMKSGVYNSDESINLSGATLQNSNLQLNSKMEIEVNGALEIKNHSTMEMNIQDCNN